jgi:hypothetical protein
MMMMWQTESWFTNMKKFAQNKTHPQKIMYIPRVLISAKYGSQSEAIKKVVKRCGLQHQLPEKVELLA